MWDRCRRGLWPIRSSIERVAASCACSRGQATVEGAFLIPVVFLLLLLLVQPGILLYDRMVMSAAAAEACRTLATRSADSGVDAEAYEESVRRHLGAIPQQENFHRHRDGCSWRIELTGDERSPQVSARITGSVKLLPLLDMGGTLLGLGDGAGNVEISVFASAQTHAAWVDGNGLGLDPSSWVDKWK
ncbi:MAG: TadE/TadG family type IV pilus assembly protein [Coriobacteriia bacterium]|nr:TadE/TadG family type IV pilus assembly protein [Coriobacteriia bacterium]